VRFVQRVALAAAAVVALPIAAWWWLIAGLLSEDHESACQGDPWAGAAFVFSNIGVALAAGALVTAVTDHRHIGWVLLAVYLLLLGGSVLIYFSCG
jgi:hypothetical protein